MMKLNNEDMRKIVYEIIYGELKDSDVKVYPVTYDEYFNKLDDNVKLNMPVGIIHNVDGYNYKGNIVIFLDKITQIKGKLAWKIFRLAENTYHEVRHTIQKKFEPYSYEGFLGNIDKILSVVKSDTYFSDYNSFSYELGANLYGLQKAREYMIKHFPFQYKKIIKKIEITEEKYKFHYMMYDASYNFNRFIIELRKNPDKLSKCFFKEFFLVLNIFMNSDLTFKSIRQIMNDSKFKQIDKKIIYAIISSELFYESINIENLSKEEVELLVSSLNYTHGIYQNQSKYLEMVRNRGFISNRTFYHNQKNILIKLKFIVEIEDIIMSQRKDKNRTIR